MRESIPALHGRQGNVRPRRTQRDGLTSKWRFLQSEAISWGRFADEEKRKKKKEKRRKGRDNEEVYKMRR